MMTMRYIFIFICLIHYSCSEKKSSIENTPTPTDISTTDNGSASFDYPVQHEVYVPIYSGIYSRSKDFRYPLTATLSIRNTSKKDSMYLKNVDYYNTNGLLVRNYLKKPIYIGPLATMEYIIKEKDTLGGSGAKFIITWGARQPVNPVFQAVMIGEFQQKIFSFTTEGFTISSKEEF